MADVKEQIITRTIQLADQIIKEADFASSFKQECTDIKIKTEKLGRLLRQAARGSNNLCERPTRRMIENAQQVLHKTLQLVFKCQANRLQRVFTIISAEALKKSVQEIEYSIKDLSWLLYISKLADEGVVDEEYVDGLPLPPIASNEPLLCLIWEQIAHLSCGTLDDRANAAANILSLAQDSERTHRMIIDEGGVPPLLKLAREGSMEG